MSFEALSHGPLHIRRLQVEDIPTMARWLSDPRVLAYYEGRDNPHDEAKVQDVFFARKEENEAACLFSYEGKPLGYVQFYPVPPEELSALGYDAAEAVYGMDQFIGEPEYWNRGIGSLMIRVVVRYLFTECGATRVIMDPVVENERAIRAYEKCGFRRVRIMPEKEWSEGRLHDCWHMVATPDTAVAP